MGPFPAFINFPVVDQSSDTGNSAGRAYRGELQGFPYMQSSLQI